VNDWGQLGNGTTTDASTQVTMRGTGTGVTWRSSNAAVATIDVTGRATGVNPGTTTITATDGSGASASTTLTVLGQTPQFTLTVNKAGLGSVTGSVSSSPSGISCGTDCSQPYDSGTRVTLTATAGSGSVFAGWSGCDTVSGATCTVTMNAAKTVTATFDLPRFVLTVSRTGLIGSVSSSPSGISCGSDCSESYAVDTVVTLTASPSLVFTGWSGCDSASGATCTVTMRSAKSVTARFLLGF
jgi:hypothetical protein